MQRMGLKAAWTSLKAERKMMKKEKRRTMGKEKGNKRKVTMITKTKRRMSQL
jgi:hypothetical protein